MSSEFEWDEAKAAENYAKHGVSFEVASLVFEDPFAIERLDDRDDYGEDRFILTGMAEGALLTVVYTERSGRVRIISARQATKHEQDEYFVENN
ncbi:MAG: BrnT family toxin [Xanthobacteraceae bacterium]|nr:BrnT family toxin [Xanthobacteraceae bacterium]